MPNNSPTAAGPSEPAVTHDRNAATQARRTALIDAINQVFTLFRLNYHNQYLKAFGNTAELNEVKRLWLEMLGQFDARTLLSAAKMVIETSEYLPTLRTMIHYCEKASSDPTLPDAHSAYLEACRAPSPKAAYAWSHPAVYHAGLASDWFFLANNPEKLTFPVFERHYLRLCEKVMNGVQLAEPNAPALPETSETPLSKDENQQRLAALRAQLDL